MSNETENPHLTAAAGWRTPSSAVHELLASAEGQEIHIPELTVARSHRWGDAALQVPSKRVATPERDPRGRWEYGIDVAEYDDGNTGPEIVSSDSHWERSPFLSDEEARSSHWYEEGRRIVKRWVPAPSPWIEVEE